LYASSNIGNEILILYGITQNPDTKVYILVLEDGHCCEYCGALGHYTCRLCHFKNNFTNWTSSGNEIIDDFIQKMQLLNCSGTDYTFEWVPYNQFNDIKQIGKDDDSILYSAIWIDGPLIYSSYGKKKYERVVSNYKVALKCLNNSQNITNEFLNEIYEV
jgi:hypothetical protein